MYSHCVLVYQGGCGRGQGLRLSLWLRLGWEGLFGAADWWLYFLYVSEGQHRAEQCPQFTLRNRSTIGVTDGVIKLTLTVSFRQQQEEV